MFKEYLDTKGAELSKTSEFLEYYALPYVDNPMEHPTFKAICTKKWANDLREKLKEFLHVNLSKNSSPEIFHWYASFKKRGGPSTSEQNYRSANVADTEELREQLEILQRQYVSLEKREEYAKSTLVKSQSNWTFFSRDILNISKELLMTMDALQVG
jgi:LisH domain-containing protein ARMC9